MFWLILVSLITLGAYYLYSVYYKYWEKKGVKQKKYPFPVLGNTVDVFCKGKSFPEMSDDVYYSYNNTRYTGLYQFAFPALMVKDPELIKQMCVKDFEIFLDHIPFMPENSDPLWNKNLFSLRGQRWKEMRTILSPSFTGSKIRQMFILMHKCAEEFVDFLNKDTSDLMEVDLKDTFTRYTNDIIATTAFGIQCDSLKDRENDFYTRGRQVSNFGGTWKIMKLMLTALCPPISKIVKPSIFDEEVSNFFRKIIKETLDYRDKNNIQRLDMINLLMQAKKGNERKDDLESMKESSFAAVSEHLKPKISTKGNVNLSLDDITSQALIFFFAGFETVSSAMCFMAHELAINTDVQQRLIEELDQCRELNETVTYETLNKLPYLDMVLSETLRKWTPTVVTDRVCNKPYTIQPKYPDEKEFNVEPGNMIWVPLWSLHHDPKFWPNPDKFDPERFSPANKEKIKPYTYLPFGVGPRNCIGSRFAIIEIKALFYGLLAHFEIVPTEKSSIPFVPNKKVFALTSANGFWFGLKKRKLTTL